ncbi:hypothetical protein EP7_003093 [Isosphaeraceae bacterium EP7]
MAASILPGHPLRHQSLLTGARLPVATFYRAESRYLLALQPSDPVVRAEGERVAPGDHLLMETDRELWVNNRMVLVGKLVALRLVGVSGIDFVLARADMDPMTRELAFDCFGVGPPAIPAGLPVRPIQMRKKSTPETLAPAESDSAQPVPSLEPAQAIRSEGGLARPALDDVAAFCILLIRT